MTPPAKRLAAPPTKRLAAPRAIKVGSRVSFKSKTHVGVGIVTMIEPKGTGDWYTVKTKDHPAGHVTVRRSQVS